MTIERDYDPRDYDPDATVEMPRPVQIDADLEDEDPEKTLAREDENWESTVIRRVAPHVEAVQNAVDDSAMETQFGWESKTLRLLSRVVARERDE